MAAYALTAYDSNKESIEDPAYGQLKAYYKTWGLEGQRGVNFEPLPFEFCSAEQLGIARTAED